MMHRTIRRRGWASLAFVPTTAVCLSMLITQSASASWTASSSGSGFAKGGTLATVLSATATCGTDPTINITWTIDANDPSPAATGYNIYRTITGSAQTFVGSVSGRATTSTTDTSTTAFKNKSVTWAVSAVDGSWLSPQKVTNARSFNGSEKCS